MNLSILRPAADLKPYLRCAMLVDDRDGRMAGKVLTTAPQLGLCLCLQLNDLVLTDFRVRRPLMSITGVQPRLRAYVPEGGAMSLILFFTALGSVRLAPDEGHTLYDEGHDSGGLLGDGAILALKRAASAAPDLAGIAAATDAWLRDLFETRLPQGEHLRVAKAADLLVAPDARVERVAERLDLSGRQLERSFRRHFGLSPKRFQMLGRVTASLNAAMTGRGDPLDGFADQPHQIRAWQATLGFTPGDLANKGLTEIGRTYVARSGEAVPDLAHYL